MVEEEGTPAIPPYLKFERVYPFTRDSEFPNWMEEVFEFIRQQVPQDQSRYSKDWVGQGLVGLANAVDRKGSRLFDLMCLGMIGKDKIEDEFRDALMEAFYAYTYYMVLEKRHGRKNTGH